MSDATSTQHYAECVAEAAAKVEQSLGKADIGIVLGSGLGHFSSLLKDPQSLGYEEIPHMPKPNVVGHQGRLYIGSIGNHRVLCFSGRVHAYEGYDMYVVSFFAQLSAALGCKIFMATNAAGAVPDARVGDFVVITDHLNFYKRNTLVDTCLDASLGERNLNTTNLYSERLQKLAFETAARLDCRIHQGVYMASMGPTYETHAEVKAGVKLGAKLFGMSTVPEISAGKSLGMEVFAMSLCTNLAAGMSEEILSHNDVTDAAEASKEAIMRFVEQFISAIDIDPNFVVKPNNPEGVKSSNIALPQIAPKASTQEDVAVAVAFLKGNGVEKVGSLVSVAPVLESSFVKDHFEIKNTFSLTDLPHFPVYSLSGREGKIAFGLHRGSGQSVLLLLNQAIEGFSIEEATFLVEISASLSATQLFFFSESSALSDQAKAADFLVIEDAANWTSIHGVSHLRPIFQQQLSNNVFSSVEGEGLKKGSVYQYDGPSFPTAIEVELAKKIEADVVSLTDLSLVYVANQIGFSIIGASIPTSSFPGFGRISFCAEKTARLSASLSSLFSSPAPASLRPLEGLVSTPFVSSFQVRTTLEKPVTQGSYEKYEESVAELKKVLAEGKVRNTFVVNSPFESLVEKLVGKTEITQSVPHLPEGQRLFLGRFSEADATTHLFLVQPLVLSQGFKPDVIAFSSRVVAAVTEENVVIVGAHVAVDEALVGGDVVVLTDHVNFTGRNGLCGHNEGRWGLRFFDMSDQYFKSLISSIQSASEAEQIVAKKVVANYSVGPIVKSKLDKSFAKLVGAQTITTTGVLEAAVLQHMRRDLPFRIASVGVCLADWTGDQVNTSFSLDDASSKLISIFRHL